MHEDSLLLKLRSGDTSAWQELVDATGDRLVKAAGLMCANHHDAEDVVQETYLRFAKNLDHFEGKSKIYTWMYGILLNIVRRRRQIASRLIITDTLPEPESISLEPGNGMDAESTSKHILAALQKLSPDHRTIIMLRYYDQLPVETIAQTLNINVGTVKSRLFHARQQLGGLLPDNLNPFKA